LNSLRLLLYLLLAQLEHLGHRFAGAAFQGHLVPSVLVSAQLRLGIDVRLLRAGLGDLLPEIGELAFVAFAPAGVLAPSRALPLRLGCLWRLPRLRLRFRLVLRQDACFQVFGLGRQGGIGCRGKRQAAVVIRQIGHVTPLADLP
jgi:hypothetical protein